MVQPLTDVDALLEALQRYSAAQLHSGHLFDFGRYNGRSRDQAADGKGLASVQVVSFAKALLQASAQGLFAPHAVSHTMLGLLKDARSKGAELNHSSCTDRDFAGFVAGRTSVIFNHLRRIKKQPHRMEQCMKNLPDGERNTLMELLGCMDMPTTASPFSSSSAGEHQRHVEGDEERAEKDEEGEELAEENRDEKGKGENKEEEGGAESEPDFSQLALADILAAASSLVPSKRPTPLPPGALSSTRASSSSGARGVLLAANAEVEECVQAAAAKPLPGAARWRAKTPKAVPRKRPASQSPVERAVRLTVGRHKSYLQEKIADGKWRLLVNVQQREHVDAGTVARALLRRVRREPDITKENLMKLRDEIVSGDVDCSDLEKSEDFEDDDC